MSNSSASAVAWSDVARACRRMCLLRERGQVDEAEQIRREMLTVLVPAAGNPDDTPATLAARFEAVLSAEEERVANAVLLAELLLPMLQEQLRSLAGRPAASSAATPAAPVSHPPFPPRAAPASIADFIDAMLDQEFRPDRSEPGSKRRVS